MTNAWRVVAANTWRLGWREPLMWLELFLLGILAGLSAIATVGSPTAGDAAVQMAAITYSVTPFALVLIIGQVGQPDDEAHWWGLVSPLDYVGGRAAGFWLLGLAIEGLVGLAGWLLMTVWAGTDALSGLMWTGWWLLIMTPSLALVVSLYLWLRRHVSLTAYYPIAILSALVIAFSEYKSALWLTVLPHWPFWNPFPAFLELGLALPPPLLLPLAANGWLWLNRAVVLGFAGLILLIAMNPSSSDVALHSRLSRAWRGVFAGLFLTTGGLAVLLWHIARVLAPLPLPQPISLSPSMTIQGAAVTVRIHPQTGQLTGIWRGTLDRVPSRAPVTFLLNAGLTVTRVTLGSHPLSVTESHGLQPATADRIWSVDDLPLRARITVTYQGTMLPRPAWLPYPPWGVGRPYPALMAGRDRVFLAGDGGWLPQWGTPAPKTRVFIDGLSRRYPILTDLRPAPNGVLTGSLQKAYIVSAPLSHRGIAPWIVWYRPGAYQTVTGLAPYGRAWRILHQTIPGLPALTVVPSPVVSHTTVVGSLLVWSEAFWYSRPRDVLADSGQEPTVLAAAGRLVIWTAPRPVNPDVLGRLLLAVFRRQPEARSLNAAIRQGRLPGYGPLSPSERQDLVQAIGQPASSRQLTRWWRSL